MKLLDLAEKGTHKVRTRPLSVQFAATKSFGNA